MRAKEIGRFKFDEKPKRTNKTNLYGKLKSNIGGGSEQFVVPWQMVEKEKKNAVVE